MDVYLLFIHRKKRNKTGSFIVKYSTNYLFPEDELEEAVSENFERYKETKQDNGNWLIIITSNLKCGPKITMVIAKVKHLFGNALDILEARQWPESSET